MEVPCAPQLLVLGGGYTQEEDEGQQAKGRHVVANGDEAREGGHQVEEVGLVETLQEVVQLPVHSLQEPEDEDTHRHTSEIGRASCRERV